MDKEDPEKKRHKSEEDSEEIHSDSMDGVQEVTPTELDATADETDLRISQPRRSDAYARQRAAVMKITPLSEDELEKLDRYNMKHPKRGIALIFNHKKFVPGYLEERLGADEDGRVMEETLRDIGFEVRLHDNKTKEQIKQILADAAKEDHKKCDCILIAIMTHGRGNGILAAYDEEHNAEDVCSMFTPNKAPTLTGKPKIFLFQACRGKMVEQSAMYYDSTDTFRPKPLIIPSNADFLVAYSSIEGYRSFRNEAFGAWFIQALCKDLKKSARKTDFLSLLTDTLRRVSYNRFSYTPKHPETDNRQEMPMFSSTLTRKLFFYETEPEHGREHLSPK